MIRDASPSALMSMEQADIHMVTSYKELLDRHKGIAAHFFKWSWRNASFSIA